MAQQNPSDEILRKILSDARTIAVVGASANPERPSHGVFRKLLAVGYRVIPVNPGESAVQGQRAYASLAEVPGPIDIVNVFRRSEYTPEIAGAAVVAGAKVLWLQAGIVNEEAAARAKKAGLTVVMDECIAVAHARLRIPHRPSAANP
jgi:predicted CoA-binding protein